MYSCKISFAQITQEVRKHSAFNNYMIYKSTVIAKNNKCIKSILKKTAEEKTSELIIAIGPENLKTAEEITAIFWPNCSN